MGPAASGLEPRRSDGGKEEVLERPATTTTTTRRRRRKMAAVEEAKATLRMGARVRRPDEEGEAPPSIGSMGRLKVLILQQSQSDDCAAKQRSDFATSF